MQEKILLTDEESKLIEVANKWILKNKDHFKFIKFTTKELIQIGKNRISIESNC